MKNKILIPRILLFVLLCVCSLSFTVFATSEISPTAPQIPVETTAPDVSVDTSTTAPDPQQPATDYVDGEGYDDEYSDTDGIVEDPDVDPGYVEDATDDYYYFDEDEMVNSIEDTAGNVSDQTTLYDTSNLDKEELKESKWDDIVLDTTSINTDEAVDFSAIKNNTATEDDSEWMLYLGYVLIALSVIGMMYYIIATVTYKKKLLALNQRQARYSEHRSSLVASMSQYPTISDYNQRYQRNRYAADSKSYSQRKRANADTAEIKY